jgi:hypothetical protein
MGYSEKTGEHSPKALGAELDELSVQVVLDAREALSVLAKDPEKVIVHRRDRRERGEFLFPVTPDPDPGSRISPQMTQMNDPKVPGALN